MPRMSPRASRRRRNFSDIPRTIVLLVWAGFACSAVFYVFDRSPPPPDAAARSQSNRLETQDDEKLYTGSIVLVEPRDRCWVRTIDNRTGSMWDQGYVSCDALVAASLAKTAPHGPGSIQRMNSIGQAFRGKGE